jgi:hypothetical protein
MLITANYLNPCLTFASIGGAYLTSREGRAQYSHIPLACDNLDRLQKFTLAKQSLL